MPLVAMSACPADYGLPMPYLHGLDQMGADEPSPLAAAIAAAEGTGASIARSVKPSVAPSQVQPPTETFASKVNTVFSALTPWVQIGVQAFAHGAAGAAKNPPELRHGPPSLFSTQNLILAGGGVLLVGLFVYAIARAGRKSGG